MSIPDSIDKQIAKLLGRDGLQSSEALAKKINISSATVRRRLRKLLQNDMIRIVAVVDPVQFELPVAAVITIDVDHSKLESAIKILAEQSEIRWVSTTTGRFDIVATARFCSTNGLSNFMRTVLAQLEGLKNSETFVCLDVMKGQYTRYYG
ncbi:Lrp/AsnC family transcriptional regulator [Chloroflexota bacterium]